MKRTQGRPDRGQTADRKIRRENGKEKRNSERKKEKERRENHGANPMGKLDRSIFGHDKQKNREK